MPGAAFVYAWRGETGERQAARWSAALATEGRWRRAEARPGFEIWTVDGAPTVAPGPSPGSVLIGRLASPAPRGKWPKSPQAIAHRLLGGAWGGYLLLIPDPVRPVPWVLRDPSGALDALTWQRGELAVLATSVEDLPAWVLPQRLSIDWDRVADVLRRPASVTAEPALAGLHVVAPGDLQPIGGKGRERIALWRPLALASAGLSTGEDLEERLRAAVDMAVTGLAAPHERRLCEVSGGLDSAIVATALAKSPSGAAGLELLHVFADLPEADEREWATAVRDAVGAPMRVAEKVMGPLAQSDFEALARGARPALNALDPGRDRVTEAHLRESGASAILTGKGGDAVFYQTPTPLLLRDHLADGGRVLGPFARDLARWLRRSVWAVARDAVFGGDRKLFGAASPFWGPRVAVPTVGPAHPWLDGVEVLPPAKRFQVEAVALAQVHRGVTRYGAVAEVLHPLLSQPVLEAVLPIPAWRFVAAGRDRALARIAFADRLPVATRERRSKGELSGVYARQLALSLSMLRPLLMDGALVDAGILDRAALDAALRSEALIWRADANTLLAAAALECWVRYWQARSGAGVGEAGPADAIRCVSNQESTRP